MPSVISPTNDELSDLANISQELSEIWGVDFKLWNFADQWLPLDGSNEECDQAKLELLTEVSGSRTTRIEPGQDSIAWLAVSVGPLGTKIVAVAKIEHSQDMLLETATRLTHLAVSQRRELDTQHEQINSYASQVTMDFEELTWLRSVAETVELHDDRNSVVDAAFAIIPSLREMTSAESIVLMPRTESGEIGESLFREGRNLISNEYCQKLVEICGADAEKRPVVRNSRSDQCLFEIPRLESLLLLRVATANYHFGWLVLINKMSGQKKVDFGGNFTENHLDPFNACEFGTYEAGLAATAASVLAAYARNSALFNDYRELLTGTIRSLVNAIDAKDNYTCGHSDRVALIARRLATALGCDSAKCHKIYMSGLLHDVGKIGVPDNVLNKAGKLTDDEFDKIKQHPVIGFEILRHVKNLSYALPGVLHHHESMDGSGYPHGLVGDKIPMDARVIAVADAYDAMTSDRAYRAGMPSSKAESILRDGSGSQWDPDVVDAFFRAAEDIKAICDKERDLRDPEAMLERASI